MLQRFVFTNTLLIKLLQLQALRTAKYQVPFFKKISCGAPPLETGADPMRQLRVKLQVNITTKWFEHFYSLGVFIGLAPVQERKAGKVERDKIPALGEVQTRDFLLARFVRFRYFQLRHSIHIS